MSVPHALGTYPYFFSDVLCLSGLLLAVRSLPVASHRRLIVRLGLVMIPNGVFSLAHSDYWKNYWHPSRVGGWALGPEDMLFAFNVGAIGCLAAVWLYRHKLIVAEQPVPRIGRILAVGVPTQCAFLVLFAISRSGIYGPLPRCNLRAPRVSEEVEERHRHASKRNRTRQTAARRGGTGLQRKAELR